MPKRPARAAFFLQDQEIIFRKVVSQVFRIGIVDLHPAENRLPSEQILPVPDIIIHAGQDLRPVEFLMGGGTDLFRHPLLRVLLSVAAHVSEMPAAVGHPDADLLAFREAELSQLQPLFLQKPEAAHPGADPLFPFHPGKFPAVGKQAS